MEANKAPNLNGTRVNWCVAKNYFQRHTPPPVKIAAPTAVSYLTMQLTGQVSFWFLFYFFAPLFNQFLPLNIQNILDILCLTQLANEFFLPANCVARKNRSMAVPMSASSVKIVSQATPRSSELSGEHVLSWALGASGCSRFNHQHFILQICVYLVPFPKHINQITPLNSELSVSCLCLSTAFGIYILFLSRPSLRQFPLEIFSCLIRQTRQPRCLDFGSMPFFSAACPQEKRGNLDRLRQTLAISLRMPPKPRFAFRRKLSMLSKVRYR